MIIPPQQDNEETRPASPEEVMAAALELVGNGLGPLPLPPGRKAPASDQPVWLKRLSGLTGKYPKMLTADEVRNNPEWWTGNLGARLPAGTFGLDIDDHIGRGKDGLLPSERLAELLPDLYETLRKCPRSTSRGPEGWGGIYLMKLPEGNDGSLLRDPCEGVQVIRHDWRYLVVAPSLVEGRPYLWWNWGKPPSFTQGLEVLLRGRQSPKRLWKHHRPPGRY